MLWGDPHVYVFDGKAHIRVLDEGDFWIVRADCVEIQGRYGVNGVITAVAVGGAFVHGHVLTVEPTPGQVLWDGAEILSTFPSEFEVDALVRAKYSGDGDHIDPGLSGLPLKSIDVELPLGIRVTVNRWPEHLDVLVSMRPLPGGQDGHCGTFNGDPLDDTLELIKSRPGGSPVPPGQSLLPKSSADSGAVPQAAFPPRDSAEACSEEERAEAEELCRSTLVTDVGSEAIDMEAFLEGCVWDVCVAGPEFARDDEVVAEQMSKRALNATAGQCKCTPKSGTTTTSSVTTITTTTSTTTSWTGTEVLQCCAFGDPHVIPFDIGNDIQEISSLDEAGALKKFRSSSRRNPFTFIQSGDYHLVKSSDASIQARYGGIGGWIEEIAVGGSFIGSHVLHIVAGGYGWDDFIIMWDGEQILKSFPSEFSGSGLVLARYSGDTLFHRKSSVRSLLIELPDMQLRVNLRLPSKKPRRNILDIFILMRERAGGQDGHCGRGVGDHEVDWLGATVPAGDSMLSSKVANLLAVHGLSNVAADPSEALGAECLGAGRPEDQALCEQELSGQDNPLALLFVDACAQDVCVAGSEMLDHHVGIALQVYYNALVAVPGMASAGGQPIAGGHRDMAFWIDSQVHWAVQPDYCWGVPSGVDISNPPRATQLVLRLCEDGGLSFVLPEGKLGRMQLAADTGKCVDVTDGVVSDGTPLQIWDCVEGNGNQQFALPAHGLGVIRWMQSREMCADVQGGVARVETGIQIWSCK